MEGKWRKRTKQEVNEAVYNRDYTGGYEWGPWLLYMRPFYILGMLMNLVLGWTGGISTIIDSPSDPLAYGIIGFFGVIVPALIMFLLRRDYKNLKKGISS